MRPHHHHHHPTPETPDGGGRRLGWSIALNLLITVAEVVGGLVSGSLALLSDALHNFSDTASLAVAYGARRLAGRAANQRKTFGYRRAEILGAFVNLITLVLIALYLMQEAVGRLLDPQPVDGPVMLVVALIGLAANLITAWLLHHDARHSLNVRSAYLHILTDAASSVGVVLGGVLILWFEVYLVDPLLTLLISVYILYHSYHLLRRTTDILMEGAPPRLDLDEVIEAVEAIDGVLDMHHLHVWQLDEHHPALEAHIVIAREDLHRMEAIKQRIKDLLDERFAIGHSTLEFEFVPCGQDPAPPCFEKATSP
ncbi:MAG: cation efflux system protein [Rhodothermaceae bacterium]|nr:MAG: cation efflux system protein [Rhodothermaceae bacterium]